MTVSLPDGWTVDTLTKLLRGAGGAPGWDGSRPLFVEADPRPDSDRPGAPTHPSTPCLVWTGSDNGMTPTYGKVRMHGRTHALHRVLYRLAHGEIPPKHDIAHTCERHLCGRPDHLRALTRAQHSREASNRRWPDWFLRLAPTTPCPVCGGPTIPTAGLGARSGMWYFNCGPCVAAWFRARRRGEHQGVPTGHTSVAMSQDVLAKAVGL